eukprot:MONOS_8029.1-p1 / transcript=MONOS_8029.1 / gene=MONOS_8029 / organism=Monocercomonoides_exilis_PA203 / gene_product=unspecified product / transcript_product=unspecified product / location=Mono_scaffold00291:69406-70890(+) / protein_length=471 / sequence_SO=supercontig / SO=protein_coding / is_pseudo=false
MKNAFYLLKHIGYCKRMNGIQSRNFLYSWLNSRFNEMIIDESEKKEGINQKLLVDLCECYLMLFDGHSSEELTPICVPYLVKVASNKKENKETQKEVEMALLALSSYEQWDEMEQELYLNEIKDIILYHQEHNNLTRLAYQSVWEFLIYRLFNNRSLEGAITNELHFIKDAIKEMEILTKNIDWKIGKEEERGKEAKELLILIRWLETTRSYFFSCKIWNEESVKLIETVSRVLRAAKENNGEINRKCINTIKAAAENIAVKVDDLLKGGAVDAVLEENHRTTLNDKITREYLAFFLSISRRLKEEEEEETEEEETEEEETEEEEKEEEEKEEEEKEEEEEEEEEEKEEEEKEEEMEEEEKEEEEKEEEMEEEEKEEEEKEEEEKEEEEKEEEMEEEEKEEEMEEEEKEEEEKEEEMEEEERKELKRKVLEKMEEEGYEDWIIGLSYYVIKEMYYSYFMIRRNEEYFVHC